MLLIRVIACGFKENGWSLLCAENLIGKGGYAEVHKGRLRDGQLVAVKRLTRGPPEERVGDFLSELGIMAHVNHPNTAKLIGYGVEGGYFLVLELSPHGSLASMMHGLWIIFQLHINFHILLALAYIFSNSFICCVCSFACSFKAEIGMGYPV